jgi:hypothetical protein
MPMTPVMSELAAAPPDGPDAALASAWVGWLARAWLTHEQDAALAFAQARWLALAQRARASRQTAVPT